MAVCSAPWPNNVVEAAAVAIRVHIDRYDADPAYRKDSDDRRARREAAYRERVAMLDALVAAGKTWPP